MKDAFRKLPEALRKQVLFRFGGSVGSLCLFLFLLWGTGDVYLMYPCLLLFCVAAGNGAWLFCRCVQGKFVHLTGKCVGIETGGFRNRIRSLYLAYETGVVKIPAKGRIRDLQKGDSVSLYLAEDAPVYEKEGAFFVGDYYAMEIRKKGL